MYPWTENGKQAINTIICRSFQNHLVANVIKRNEYHEVKLQIKRTEIKLHELADSYYGNKCVWGSIECMIKSYRDYSTYKGSSERITDLNGIHHYWGRKG